uniref:Uncharacterized protein n=1 Tax=Magallana gigas TaxID=29159 RepID=K1RFB7_MAGGI
MDIYEKKPTSKSPDGNKPKENRYTGLVECFIITVSIPIHTHQTMQSAPCVFTATCATSGVSKRSARLEKPCKLPFPVRESLPYQNILSLPPVLITYLFDRNWEPSRYCVDFNML